MRDRTPARTILEPAQINEVAAAVLALGREMWTLRDRLTILEAVLEKHGIDATAEIDGFDVDPALQARLDADRDRMIGALAAAFAGDA
ncbi:hypothetical protein [uncultured Sphingomonas sp.]|uniref:hypothetical protein n=1 Tax=uncultured Sphingomonas sp. TaxID=158754 RepID=UPI0035CBF6B5